MDRASALALVERAGNDKIEKANAFHALLADEELHRDLARATKADREGFIGTVKAHIGTLGRIGALRDALKSALRARLAEGGEGTAGTIFGLPLPPGYHVDSGTSRLIHTIAKDDGTVELVVAHRPIAMTSRVQDPAEGHLHAEVSWSTSTGGTERAVIRRSAAMDSRAIVSALAGEGTEGAPIHGRNAGAVIEYLAAQEAAAGPDMPTSILSRAIGWAIVPPEHPPVYLAGETLIQGQHPPASIQLHQGEALRSFAARVRPAGDLDGWCAIVVPVAAQHPVIGLCILASLAPVMLQVIHGTPSSGIVDLAGLQGSGKTSALGVAASCWGPPSMSSGPGLQLDGTTAGLREHRLMLGTGFPLILNETQFLRADLDLLTSLIFSIFEGTDRARMGAEGGGLKAARSTRTGALLSGNTAVVDLLPDVEGIRTRVLTVREPPWTSQSREAQGLVMRTERDLHQHHGTAGPAMVRHLLAHRDRWAGYIKTWTDRVRHWSDVLGLGAERYATIIALYELTGRILDVEIVRRTAAETFAVAPCLAVAIRAAQSSSEDLDLGLKALRHVVDWAAHSPTHFYASGRTPPPSGTWRGVWDGLPGSPLCIGQGALCDELRRKGWTPEDILKNWHARQWLKTDPGRRTARVSLGGQQIAHYVFRPEALEAAGMTRTEAPDDRQPQLPPAPELA